MIHGRHYYFNVIHVVRLLGFPFQFCPTKPGRKRNTILIYTQQIKSVKLVLILALLQEFLWTYSGQTLEFRIDHVLSSMNCNCTHLSKNK